MNNTLENKAKFFAQYWGQKIYPTVCGLDIVEKYIDPMYDTSVIELKSLSSVTDEDSFKMGFGNKKSFLEIANHLHVNKTSTADFLRSKGYALPWMGLSVKTLQEYGWIKLK